MKAKWMNKANATIPGPTPMTHSSEVAQRLERSVGANLEAAGDHRGHCVSETSTASPSGAGVALFGGELLFCCFAGSSTDANRRCHKIIVTTLRSLTAGN